MKIFKVYLFSLFMISFSCKMGDTQSASASKNVIPFYISSFYKNIDEPIENCSFVKNNDQSMVLCVGYSTDTPQNFVYEVFNINTQKKIYSSGFIGSNIGWKSLNELEIGGTSRIDSGETIIVNVLTKESRIEKTKKTN